jgi:rSAM/selenodomain-associated transferase 2
MTPRFSVIIPTLNEGARIAATIASARAALGSHVEIIVSDAGSTDLTAANARAAGARVITGARGRGPQLDAGVRAAEGEICVLLHADTLLPPGCAHRIEATLRSAVAGAFLLAFEESRLQWLAHGINLRSRLLRTATGDQAMFARRDTLLAVGGVPHIELFEDVRLWKKLKRAGRVRLVAAQVTTSARLWQQLGTMRGVWLHLRLRALHALGVPPHKLAKLYPTAGS